MPLYSPAMWQHMQRLMDGGMMWERGSAARFGRWPDVGMGLGGLIVLILVVLVIAALVKYIFFR
jgi:hypothetical protein